MLCICACLNLMIFEGVPGLWKAVAATCAGAAASAASFGLHFHPDTPLRTTLPCILVLSLYLLMFAHGGYMRGLALRDSRRQLSDKLEEVSALQAKLQEQVARDSLTGLYNRRHFDLAFARQLQACREGGEAMTLTMIDIDHFKRINDTYGHLAGDEMLKRLAELLAARTRGDGLACRYGGEEFLLALPGTAARAQALAEELRGEFEAARVEFDGYSMHTTLSFGIAAFPDDGGVPVDLLKAADVALYVAKLRGRNCVVLSAEAA
jgi:diguanylate cyclase (GGDEF)-like protein